MTSSLLKLTLNSFLIDSIIIYNNCEGEDRNKKMGKEREKELSESRNGISISKLNLGK